VRSSAIVRAVMAILMVAAASSALALRAGDACAQQPATSDRSTRAAFDLALSNGKVAVTGSTIKAKKGDELELRWTSDRPISLHLHGYDIEANVSPQSPAVMSFKATIAGRFAISEHGNAGRERAVLYLEVHP